MRRTRLAVAAAVVLAGWYAWELTTGAEPQTNTSAPNSRSGAPAPVPARSSAARAPAPARVLPPGESTPRESEERGSFPWSWFTPIGGEQLDFAGVETFAAEEVPEVYNDLPLPEEVVWGFADGDAALESVTPDAVDCVGATVGAYQLVASVRSPEPGALSRLTDIVIESTFPDPSIDDCLVAAYGELRFPPWDGHDKAVRHAIRFIAEE